MILFLLSCGNYYNDSLEYLSSAFSDWYLIQNPQNNYKSLVKKYKKQLEKWIEKTNDLGRISEKEIIENSYQ